MLWTILVVRGNLPRTILVSSTGVAAPPDFSVFRFVFQSAPSVAARYRIFLIFLGYSGALWDPHWPTLGARDPCQKGLEWGSFPPSLGVACKPKRAAGLGCWQSPRGLLTAAAGTPFGGCKQPTVEPFFGQFESLKGTEKIQVRRIFRTLQRRFYKISFVKFLVSTRDQ
uniref:Uncharacterized protein n=1 Tax=Anthurium amnicola TaxID=1678845 RepID=A0A1D1Z346_9ARAE